jgi:hypothetical protein
MAKVTLLSNGVVLRPWTTEEDEILRANLVTDAGTYTGDVKTSWMLLRHQMQWRSVDQMRARWRRIRHLYLPGARREKGPPKGNKCTRCGAPRAGHACPFLIAKDAKTAVTPSTAHHPKKRAKVAKAAAPPAPLATKEAPLCPVLDDFVVWRPASHEDIGDYAWVEPVFE